MKQEFVSAPYMTKKLLPPHFFATRSSPESFQRWLLAGMLFAVFWSQLLYAAWRPGEMKVRISDVSEQVVTALLEIGIEVEHSHGDEIYLYLIEAELQQLLESGIRPEILIPDMIAYSRQLLEQEELRGYRDYARLNHFLDSLQAAYPKLIHKTIYGRSVEGKALVAVKISDNAAVDEPEPEIAFDAAQHGDEIMTTELLMKLMVELCERYASVDRIRKLVNETEIWFFPMVNPDGRQLLTRRNSNFVDINRDWGYMWDGWGNSSQPYSQPETRALLRWLLDHQFTMMISLHAGAELISHPWSYRPGITPDQENMRLLASKYAAVSGYEKLPFGEGFDRLYPISGSAKDSYYGIRGAMSWTLEICDDKLRAHDQVAEYYKKNRRSLLQLIEMSQQGISGRVSALGSGKPLPAIIRVRNGDNEYWPVYSDPALGDFHKFLPPGTYSLTIEANGYRPLRMSSVKVDSTGIDVDAKLIRRPGVHAFQVLACQVPGNNFANNGLTWQALGQPDGRGYSLGRGGWIVLDMGERLFDLPGADIRIVSSGKSEGFMLEAAEAWTGPWQTLGKASGTAKFDISEAKVKQFRYLRITDDGDGFTGIADAGFDLDAVEALLIPENSAYLMAANHTIIDTLSNYNGVLEAGETTGIDLHVENLGDLTAPAVTVQISSASRYLQVVTDTASLFSVGDGSTSTTGGLQIRALPSTPHHASIPLEVRIRAADQEWRHLINLEISGGASIETGNSELTFGEGILDFAQSQPLLLNNPGKDTLKIFQARTTSEAFWVEDQQMLIPPGGQAEMVVFFEPGKIQSYQDTLIVLNNDPLATRHLVLLSGSAASLPALQLSEDSIAAAIGIDDSLELTVELGNDGAGELMYFLTLSETIREDEQQGFAYPLSAVQHLLLPDDDQPAEGARGRLRIPFHGEQPYSERIELPFTFPFLSESYPAVIVDRHGQVLLQPEPGANDEISAEPAQHPQILPLYASFDASQSPNVSLSYQDDQVSILWQGLVRHGYEGSYNVEVRLTASGLVEFLYHDVAEVDSTFHAGVRDMHGRTLLDLHEQVRSRQHLTLPQSGEYFITPQTGLLGSNERETIRIRFRTRGLMPGIYLFNLHVSSNDPIQEERLLPIRLAVEEVVGVTAETGDIPESAQLFQNYPNPFNPVTTIAFHIAEQAQTRLIVYNTLGQAVRGLVDEPLSPGEYQVSWDGRNDFGQHLPSGIYFYELQTRNFSQIRKMILLH